MRDVFARVGVSQGLRVGLLAVVLLPACASKEEPPPSPVLEMGTREEGQPRQRGTTSAEAVAPRPAPSASQIPQAPPGPPRERTKPPKATEPSAQVKSQPKPSPQPGAREPERSPTAAQEEAAGEDQRQARVTPADQSESSSDIEVTQRIRQALLKEETLSFKAKNVTVVTANGRVTLSGRVNTRAEAERIKEIVQGIAPEKVDDQLQIRE